MTGMYVHHLQAELLLAGTGLCVHPVISQHFEKVCGSEEGSQWSLLTAHGDEVDLQQWIATISCLLLSVSLVMSFFLRFSLLLLFSSFQPADGTKKITFCLFLWQSEVSRS